MDGVILEVKNRNSGKVARISLKIKCNEPFKSTSNQRKNPWCYSRPQGVRAATGARPGPQTCFPLRGSIRMVNITLMLCYLDHTLTLLLTSITTFSKLSDCQYLTSLSEEQKERECLTENAPSMQAWHMQCILDTQPRVLIALIQGRKNKDP